MRVCKRNIKCKKGWSINNFGNKFFRFILKFILCHTISILVLNNCCEVIYGRLLRKAYTIGGLIISGYYQYFWWINGTAPAWWVPWLLCRLMQGFFLLVPSMEYFILMEMGKHIHETTLSAFAYASSKSTFELPFCWNRHQSTLPYGHNSPQYIKKLLIQNRVNSGHQDFSKYFL